MFFLKQLAQERNKHISIVKENYDSIPGKEFVFLYPFLCANICFKLNQKNINLNLLKNSFKGGIFFGNNVFFRASIKKTVTDVYGLKPKILTKLSENNHKAYEDAFNILVRCTKIFSKELKLVHLGSVFLKGKKIIAFTEIELPGIIFIKPRNEDENITFFLEHIIHEVAHVSLNYLLQDLKKNFKVENVFDQKYFSPFRAEKRGLFGTFHASFVLGRLIIIFEELLKSKKISNKNKLEIFARMLLCVKRLQSILPGITGDYYQGYSKVIFDKLLGISQKSLSKYSKHLSELDYSNQDVEFVYSKFVKVNPEFIKNHESILKYF